MDSTTTKDTRCAYVQDTTERRGRGKNYIHTKWKRRAAAQLSRHAFGKKPKNKHMPTRIETTSRAQKRENHPRPTYCPTKNNTERCAFSISDIVSIQVDSFVDLSFQTEYREMCVAHEQYCAGVLREPLTSAFETQK